ncbi:MAG: hypothetical protein SFY92_06975 [Verrucomicrobiae bacterium]|nr:hypothetical protein [Verrucomicrobiae bacterium]
MASPYHDNDLLYFRRLGFFFVHACLLTALFLYLMFFFKVLKVFTANFEKQSSPKLTFERIPPEMPAPVASPDPLSKKGQQQFINTLPNQESSDPPKDTPFYSDRNTAAASSSPGVMDSPLPNQQGTQNKSLSFTDSALSPEMRARSQAQKNAPPAPTQAPPAPSAATTPPPPARTETPVKKPDPALEDAILQSASKNAQLVAKPEKAEPPKAPTPQQMALNTKNDPTPPPPQTPAKPATTPPVPNAKPTTPSPPKPQPQLQRPSPQTVDPSVASPAQDGNAPVNSAGTPFEQRTQIAGGRSAVIRDMASFDAVGTPLGTWVNHVLNKIKFRWYPLVQNSSSLLKVGIVRAKFTVDKDGNITSLLVKSNSGDIIFENVCRNAIVGPDEDGNRITFNAMPPEVQALIGDSKEFEISFALY